jgi:hypothetical protein
MEEERAARTAHTREEQGLPPTIEDDATLEKVAALLVDPLKDYLKDLEKGCVGLVEDS